MLEILRGMIKEEWRVHSSLFGGFMFALFPVILMIMAFIGSLFIPVLKTIIPTGQMWIISQYTFMLFGLSVGSFGLFGREVMNRRFGHASLMAYSSRTLPLSERNIFLNFFVKDVIYYFFLWVFPFALGFAFALPLISVNLFYSLSLLLVSALSFLMGLSIVFFMSTIYAHSLKLLTVILVSLIVALSVSINYIKFSFELFPFFLSPSASQILFSLLVITIPSAFSFIFLKVDYPQKKRLFRNSLDRLSNLLKFNEYSVFVSKDLLDFNRSEGGIGKIIFSFLFPLAMIWLLILILLKFVPVLNMFVVFSIFLGIISSSFYNWFTEFDSFNSYAFLPIKVSTVIKSKINSYIIINLVSLAVLIFVALWTGQSVYFLPALLSFVSISSYALATIVYLTGLNPNVLLYNAKIFLQYLMMLSPLLLVFIFLSVLNPFYLIASPVLILLSYKIVKNGYERWDNKMI